LDPPFSTNDIRGVILDDQISELVVMKDVATSEIIHTTPSEIKRRLDESKMSCLPVVNEGGGLEGVISRSDLQKGI